MQQAPPPNGDERPKVPMRAAAVWLALLAALFLITQFTGEGIATSTLTLWLQDRFGQIVTLDGVELGIATAGGHLSDRFGRLADVAGSLLLAILGFLRLAVAGLPHPHAHHGRGERRQLPRRQPLLGLRRASPTRAMPLERPVRPLHPASQSRLFAATATFIGMVAVGDVLVILCVLAIGLWAGIFIGCLLGH